MNPIRLVLFDDHPCITEAIEGCLSKYKNILILEKFNIVENFLNYINKNHVDVIITGILSRDEIGISMISQIRKYNKSAKIIIFSGVSSPYIIQTILEAGADAYVSKKQCVEKLYQKIIEVNSKENVVNYKYKTPVRLTIKEKNIIHLLKEGKSSKEISEITCTSVNTINNQKNHLIEKFKCANSNELIIKLIGLGYLEI
ncbi:MAG: response regulator transcription factor [Saprospiraceae bacterium]|jgi:DNA-binding NarL/FixJ family response regulator|nr:response regulator transcription factor [Saprospiraceae bacterium]MBK6665472.1 response regulator transcription factor [Saprospiraceae bacterium]MBK9582709.1 response regulator transcription factor [Saprospiraceae bacterium]MBK9743620.1 response regulator transcription factor [Saprospiraceae bacterium]